MTLAVLNYVHFNDIYALIVVFDIRSPEWLPMPQRRPTLVVFWATNLKHVHKDHFFI